MKKVNSKTGVLIVNLGTPDSPETSDVRKYLREFLMDWRVIDFPFMARWLLVNGIIAPFRSPKTAKNYRKLWDERGSSLKYYGEDVKKMLQEKLGADYKVALGMRYQSPSIQEALSELQADNVHEIVCIPLFPQYAAATTGSVIEKVNQIVNTWQIIPSLKFVNQFFDHPYFIKAFADRANKMLQQRDYDHFVFSYHGIPESQIKKGSFNNYCQLGKCCAQFNKMNIYCYRAQCFYTSRLLAKAIGIPDNKYTVSFQSRLGPTEWVKPYTDEVLKSFPEQGIKDVMVFSPAFIADCLETTLEVGEEFKEAFEQAGGNRWDLVPSLNDHPYWVDCLKDLVYRFEEKQNEHHHLPLGQAASGNGN